MKQIARELTNFEDGFLNGKRYLLMDRDSTFSAAFRGILEGEHVIFFGENMLRRAVGQFLLHYHQERNHQGLGNKIIEPTEEVGRGHGEIECRERLGGLLRYYHRKAA